MLKSTQHSKSSSIPFYVMFTRCHCSKCGSPMKIHKETTVYTPDMPEFKEEYRKHRRRGAILPPSKKSTVTVTEREKYYCPQCGSVIHYEDQMILHEIQKHLKCPVLSPSQIDSNYKLGKCRSILRSILINDSVLLIVSALFSILGIWGYGPWGWEASAGFLGMSALCLIFLIIIPTVKQIVKYFQIKNRDF